MNFGKDAIQVVNNWHSLTWKTCNHGYICRSMNETFLWCRWITGEKEIHEVLEFEFLNTWKDTTKLTFDSERIYGIHIT